MHFCNFILIKESLKQRNISKTYEGTNMKKNEGTSDQPLLDLRRAQESKG